MAQYDVSYNISSAWRMVEGFDMSWVVCHTVEINTVEIDNAKRFKKYKKKFSNLIVY